MLGEITWYCRDHWLRLPDGQEAIARRMLEIGETGEDLLTGADSL
ncbi:hypothetical protein [Tardibacter chloracetimidivorans]|nr:hypothetical protein [Tardibacter chloracetimidivorans]